MMRSREFPNPCGRTPEATGAVTDGHYTNKCLKGRTPYAPYGNFSWLGHLCFGNHVCLGIHAANFSRRGGKIVDQIKLGAIISSLLYSFIGVLVFWVSFLFIDKLTPYHLWKEIIEEKNTSLAIVVGGIAVGICIIVAAAIH